MPITWTKIRNKIDDDNHERDGFFLFVVRQRALVFCN